MILHGFRMQFYLARRAMEVSIGGLESVCRGRLLLLGIVALAVQARPVARSRLRRLYIARYGSPPAIVLIPAKCSSSPRRCRS